MKTSFSFVRFLEVRSFVHPFERFPWWSPAQLVAHQGGTTLPMGKVLEGEWSICSSSASENSGPSKTPWVGTWSTANSYIVLLAIYSFVARFRESFFKDPFWRQCGIYPNWMVSASHITKRHKTLRDCGSPKTLLTSPNIICMFKTTHQRRQHAMIPKKTLEWWPPVMYWFTKPTVDLSP